MSDTATPAPERLPDGRVPIVIGITGHRNIASDDPALRAVVRAEFEALARLGHLASNDGGDTFTLRRVA